MKMELTNNMAGIVQDIVGRTPNEITNMSVEELEKHVKAARKRNRMFYKLRQFPLWVKKRHEFSQVLPRGSMIAVHHRFTFREETNKKIMKIR